MAMIPAPKNITELDIDILARTIWGEARGESRQGKIAVAWVILNRTTHARRWPDDIQGVCLEKFQFSCWLENDPNRQKMRQVGWPDLIFRECLQVALSVCLGLEQDPTEGADHYLVSSIADKTKWARGETPVCRIGHHAFYKLA